MDEVFCIVAGLIAGIVGGGLGSLIFVSSVKLMLEKKINGINLQLFSLRLELNKWNDDNTV